jgi:hypothetical protein
MPPRLQMINSHGPTQTHPNSIFSSGEILREKPVCPMGITVINLYDHMQLAKVFYTAAC